MNFDSYPAFFKDKTVTLMGLGLLGRGVGDAAFLAAHCRKVYVTDMKSAEELQASVAALKDFKNIEFILGRHETQNFTSVDMVIKGAGVRLDNPYILEAERNKIPVYMSTALFAKFAPIKTLGVTGTRGKSSTTYMIAEILGKAGKKVLLGGNVRGVSTLAMLPQAGEFDIAVLELDSWQLQGFDALGISPNIGVFTTFYPDHMNYYDDDMRRYLHDKTAIFRNQKPGDVFITTPDIFDLTKEERVQFPPQGQWKTVSPLPSTFGLKIPGAHNLLNAALAKEAAKACGAGESVIDDALRNFNGVEGRLQLVGTWQGREFYNDSNATTQEATLAALTSFPAEQIILIFGGADKGLQLDQLISTISRNNIRCVLIKGTGSDRVLKELPNLNVVDSMQAAVAYAKGASKPNDRIILSPAFASFGVFKNEYDRSDQFLREVRNVIAEVSR